MLLNVLDEYMWWPINGFKRRRDGVMTYDGRCRFRYGNLALASIVCRVDVMGNHSGAAVHECRIVLDEAGHLWVLDQSVSRKCL
jgi:hypothetical protein